MTPFKQRRHLSEGQKAFFWKAFEQQRFNWYRKANGIFIKTLKDEVEQVSQVFEDEGQTGVVKFFNNQIPVWKKNIRALSLEVSKEFGQNTFNQILKSNQDIETKQFNPQDAAVLKWSTEHAAMRATLIAETSKDLANRLITDGITAGKQTDQISKDLRQFYDEQSNFRAMRTARTEVVGASNFGSYEAAKQTEVVQTKTWLSSRDDRVRDEHEFMDEETVSLDDIFSNGCEYPGDDGGDPEEVINCRCVLAYNVEEGQMTETIEPEKYSEISERGEIDVNWRDVESQINQDYAVRGITLQESSGSVATDNYISSEASQLHGTVLRWSTEDGSTYTRYLQQQFAKNGKYPDILPEGWYQGTDAKVAKQILEDHIADVKKLEKMIDVLPNYPEKKILYRALNFEKNPEVWEMFQTLPKGSIIDMKGTSSWTPSQRVAKLFARGEVPIGQDTKSVTFILEGGSKQSASISHMAEYSKEKEVIISQVSRFEVVEVRTGTLQTNVILKEVR